MELKNQKSVITLEQDSEIGSSFFRKLFIMKQINLFFRNLVPISLLVTLEMVKFIQGIVISKDKYMFHLGTQTGTVVQSSNLNEELGQIDYIFSDKTGTLTQNYMEFRKLVAKGVPYGSKSDIQDISAYPEVTNVNFRDSSFYNALKANDKSIDGI